MTIGLYGLETAERIHDAVLGGEAEPQSLDSIYDEDKEPVWFLAKLTETLLYPDPDEDNPVETGQTTAKANVLYYAAPENPITYDMQEVTVEEVEVTITNRNPLIFAAKGDYIWCRLVEAEFVPLGLVRNEVDAVLTEDLDPANDVLTDPSTATFKILHPNSDGDLVVTSWEETLTNRFIDISLEDKTYITVKRLNGEWRLSAADCKASSIDHTTDNDDDLLGEQP